MKIVDLTRDEMVAYDSGLRSEQTLSVMKAHNRATVMARKTGHEVAIVAGAHGVIEWIIPYVAIQSISPGPQMTDSTVDWNGF